MASSVKKSAPAKKCSPAKSGSKAKKTPPAAVIPQELIAARAHSLWLEGGCRHGSHLEDWLRAEQELRGKA